MKTQRAIQQFSVNRAAFERELSFVSMAGETKTTIPILSTVKLDAADGILKLTATNLDVTAQSQVEIDASPSTAICVDLRRLLALVKNMGEGEILLSIEPDRLQLKSGRSKFSLNGRNPDDFPNVEVVEGQSLELHTSALKAMLTTAARAVDKEVSRFGTNALAFIVTKGRAVMIGCDQKMVVKAEVDLDIDVNIGVGLLRAFFPALSSLFSSPGSRTTCVVGERAVKFQNGMRAVSGGLMATKLFDYDLFFNKKREPLCEFDRVDFQQALSRLLVMSDETEKGLKPMSLALTDGQIEIATEAKDAGAGNDGFAVTDYVSDYKCRSNAMNFRVLLDVCWSPRIRMSGNSDSSRFDAEWAISDSLNLRFAALSMHMANPKGGK